jgi:mono/diheme cytochrome c family protein
MSKNGFVKLVFLLLASFTMATGLQAQTGPTDGISAINGLVVDPISSAGKPRPLLLATQYGLLRASPNGTSTVIGNLDAAIVGLATAPGKTDAMLLSGIDKDNQPTGLLKSIDGGVSWQKLSKHPVALTGLAYGENGRMVAIDKTIQVSEDGGETWNALATSPEQVFSVAVSSLGDNALFAATMGGLMQSVDGGKSWSKAFDSDQPATLVTSLGQGRMVAFIYGIGLIETDATNPGWRVLKDGFQDRYMLNMVADPANADILYATVDTAAILMSRDGGKNWISYEGSDKRTPARMASGKVLFEENCQVCHGVKGIGEDPANPAAKDEFGYKAPPLNNDGHAWHHSDQGLSTTIHKGSPQNKRMIAWQDQLSDNEIDDLLVYIKSNWNLRSLSCQGGRHMRCTGN